VTLDLDHGETLPLLLNALDNYARILDSQSAEQHERQAYDYAQALARTAQEARDLVELITRASNTTA
jgi:hypothetical protein